MLCALIEIKHIVLYIYVQQMIPLFQVMKQILYSLDHPQMSLLR